MGKVLYSMNVSLDGYIEDANGRQTSRPARPPLFCSADAFTT